ncbi:hypothetical protein ZIOFF_046260 [Zingiber officinale]|uniref:Uncharacterized protein n=1 Tax=Zingiber officinale TaxID=94328 RepID=A0A8J5FZX2_ZINOF|nr:hypothetical protein ZIOFF_046260 [Zingiber officinale]
MSAKRSWRSDALMQLRQSRMLEVTDMKERDPMFAAFLLSYDSLEDDNMRAPLLCGSLWPEGFKIHKVELIQRWIGLGLINEFNSINKEFHRELSHIETLTFTCLLELVDSEHTVGTDITEILREIKMLSELQHLNLNSTPVVTLTAELSSLAKLKVGTEHLIKVPMGTLSNLPLLKLLGLYESKYANLNELEGFQ